MVQTKDISFQLFASGYCTAHERVVNPKTGRGIARFYAVWALMQHPAFGTMLFDCGYTPEFKKVTASFPELLYRLATPVHIEEYETAKSILVNKGIAPDSVDYIVLSHFHADHICGIHDFPNAKFICNRSSLDEVRKRSGLGAVRKGILKQLLPENFDSRVLLLQDISEAYIEPHSGLTFFRFFGQDTFELAELPGHAKGMLGLKVSMKDQNFFYCTDASWNKKAFDQNILPMKTVKLFIDSWKEYVHTIDALKSFEQSFPDYRILFTHCPETLTYTENHVL